MLRDIFESIKKSNSEDEYEKFLLFIKNKDIVLYGAGGIGRISYNILKTKGFNIKCFIDDDIQKVGQRIDNVEIVSLKNIHFDDKTIIIITAPSPIDIFNNLKENGFDEIFYFPIMMSELGFYNKNIILNNEDKIFNVYDLLNDSQSRLVYEKILQHRLNMNFGLLSNIISPNQYFPSKILNLDEKECFVDGGAFDGATIRDFLNITEEKYQCIYAFEPDRANYIKLKKVYEDYDENMIKIFNSGLYSRNGEIGFCSHGNSSSFISENEADKISVVKLDDVIDTCIPTFIKLDIEGAEAEAILGMKEILKNYKPKLAISAYHRPEDLWELPLLIHSINKNYKIYMRHYLQCLNETVCYAF